MSRGNVRRISTRVNDDTERRAAYETWLQSGLVLPCTPYDAFCAGYVARQAKRCGVCGADGDGNLQAARQEIQLAVAKESPQPAAPKAPETIEEQICSALKRGAKRPSQVATAINRPVSIVNARMLEMLRAGLLTRTGEGRAVVYQIVGSA